PAAAVGRTRLLLPLVGGPSRPTAAAAPTVGPSRAAAPTVGPAARPAGPTATPVPLPPPEGPPILRPGKWGVGVYRESNPIFDDVYASQSGVILLMDPSPGWAR